MSVTEALLVVVVLVLIIYMMHARNTHHAAKHTHHRAAPIAAAAQPTLAVAATTSPEATALKGNLEHFLAQSESSDVLSYQCADDGTFAYASAPFGSGNSSFTDWITSQSVDPTVVSNHASFVADVQDNTNNKTGRTYAIPDIDVDNSGVPWQGLRRPQNIGASAKAGGLQLTDGRESSYTDKPTFTWSSSQ